MANKTTRRASAKASPTDGTFDLRPPGPMEGGQRPELGLNGVPIVPRVTLGCMEETNGGAMLEPLPGFDEARARNAGLRLVAGPARRPEGAIRSGFRPETIIGNGDERIPVEDPTALPWRSIALLSIIYEDGTRAEGTAWFIGPKALATAGHNVFHPSHGRAISVTVTPGYDGQHAPFGSVVASKIHCDPAWMAGSNDPSLDYGVVLLADGTLGKRLGWFGLASFPDAQLSKMLVNVSGYAADLLPRTQYFNGGRITEVTASFVGYDFDTSEGMSGAPIFARFRDQRVAIGIHTMGSDFGNRARRIDDALYELLLKFI